MSKPIKKFKPDISIIVPVHNETHKTVQCFASIRAHTSTPYELIWVDNASSPDAFSMIRRQATRPRVHCKLVRNLKNLGYVKAVNQGIAEAKGKFIILLNNDTEVTAGWDKKLLRPFASDKKIGAVGPVTDSNIAWQGLLNVNHRWRLGLPKFTGDVHKYALKLDAKFKFKCIVVGGRKLPLSFFCCCVPRSLFKDIGTLDEAFGIGLGDDDDMAIRMAAYGYHQLLALGCFVRHYHRTTFNALKIGVDSVRRNAIRVLKRNSVKYKEIETNIQRANEISNTSIPAETLSLSDHSGQAAP